MRIHTHTHAHIHTQIHRSPSRDAEIRFLFVCFSYIELTICTIKVSLNFFLTTYFVLDNSTTRPSTIDGKAMSGRDAERDRDRKREREKGRTVACLRQIPSSKLLGEGGRGDTNYSKVTGIDKIGRIGFVVSTSNAVAMQSLAASTSPSDSNTTPRLYLKAKYATNHLSIDINAYRILSVFGMYLGTRFNLSRVNDNNVE